MQILTKTNGEALKIVKKSPKEAVVEKIKQSGLSGRGGARFPTWMKIDSVMKSPVKERYLICNAKEGEPGSLKDKFILKNNPELLIEGMSIVVRLIDAKKSYIFLNEKYRQLKTKLKKEIKKSGLDIEIHLSKGKYICGEETALIESLENGEAVPRDRPPYITTFGLYGKPTCLMNVETLSNIPLILLLKDWNEKLQLFSITGDVKKPGVYEIETGTELEKIIDLAEPVKTPKAIGFGYSGGFMPYFKNTEVDYGKIESLGCVLGSRNLIVFNNDKSMPKASLNIAKFFYEETCGKCVPCRKGSHYIYLLLKKICGGKCKKGDLKHLEEIAHYTMLTSFCGLGKSSTSYLLTALKYFGKEFESLCK